MVLPKSYVWCFPCKQIPVGTTEAKRTTVPFMYNLDQRVEGLDVVDFPGVDDRDETIPDLAELLLFLAQVVIFVVDYRFGNFFYMTVVVYILHVAHIHVQASPTCSILNLFINPRRACAARVTVICLCVCLSTTILGLQATGRLISDTNSFSTTMA